MVGKGGAEKENTLPVISIMVSNVLILLHTLYFSYFKLKKGNIMVEKIFSNIKLIQAFIKLNYDNEKVWRRQAFQDHPH